jgi:thiosulfate/3-mercaptopyruvate sulfurtransferase
MTALPDRHRWFVSTDWLGTHLETPDVVVVDASWHMPAANRDPDAEYRAGHIPGAVRFDIDAIADHTTALPHMLPSAEAFSSAVRKLGIGDGMTIVIYDSVGLQSAPRAWWTFKVFGARDVYILDGGLPAWIAESRPLSTDVPVPSPRHFTARLDHSMVKAVGEVRHALLSKSAQVVDARPANRFKGEAPEPRAGVKSGHMPGALNVPSGKLVADGRLASPDAVAAAFAEAGVDVSQPIITSCGSGVTAAILWLALETVGAPKLGLYDGSWTDWGSRDDTEIVTG